jgi:hypothetical protein
MGTQRKSSGLSHWVLELCTGYPEIVAPEEGSYQTVVSGYGCGSTYNCQQATCTVDYGVDPTTGLKGIKFEDCVPLLGDGGTMANGTMAIGTTQIFQFTLLGVPTAPEDVSIAFKAGVEEVEGLITGPACSTTAVTMQNFSATSQSAAVNPLLVALAVGLVSLAGAALAWRSARG